MQIAASICLRCELQAISLLAWLSVQPGTILPASACASNFAVDRMSTNFKITILLNCCLKYRRLFHVNVYTSDSSKRNELHKFETNSFWGYRLNRCCLWRSCSCLLPPLCPQKVMINTPLSEIWQITIWKLSVSRVITSSVVDFSIYIRHLRPTIQSECYNSVSDAVSCFTISKTDLPLLFVVHKVRAGRATTFDVSIR